MNVRAIVPQKTLGAAKSRLTDVLGAPLRVSLSLALLRHVWTTLRSVPRVESVTIMTPDREVCAKAGSWGGDAVFDRAPDLNTALTDLIARTNSAAGGARGTLIVAADLPWLAAPDVSAFLAAGTPSTLVLAPSKDGMGTNALLIPAGVSFRTAYGDGSRAAHAAGARQIGLRLREVYRSGLAFDIDTPADLASLRWTYRGGLS
jgi:2-phospho-L-lactate/phosphoenolpyruvate guanylyltransferase